MITPPIWKFLLYSTQNYLHQEGFTYEIPREKDRMLKWNSHGQCQNSSGRLISVPTGLFFNYTSLDNRFPQRYHSWFLFIRMGLHIWFRGCCICIPGWHIMVMFSLVCCDKWPWVLWCSFHMLAHIALETGASIVTPARPFKPHNSLY